MILFVDEESKVKAVNTTTDASLRALYVDESNPMFPFKGWSTAKICCYIVSVSDGVVTMMTPYVDSRLLDSVDQMGHQVDNLAPWKKIIEVSRGDTSAQFDNVPSGVPVALVEDYEGNVIPNTYTRNNDIVTVTFEALEYAADVILTVG